VDNEPAWGALQVLVAAALAHGLITKMRLGPNPHGPFALFWAIGLMAATAAVAFAHVWLVARLVDFASSPAVRTRRTRWLLTALLVVVFDFAVGRELLDWLQR
jgi:hypothetical protein